MKWTSISIISLWLLLFSWTTYDLYQLEVIPDITDIIYDFLTGILFGLLIGTFVKLVMDKFESLEDCIYSSHLVILNRLRDERNAEANGLRQVAQSRLQRPWNREDREE